jgi:hypothetical protein
MEFHWGHRLPDHKTLKPAFLSASASLQHITGEFVLPFRVLISLFVPAVSTCDNVSAALGLPVLPARATVAQCCERVMIYLGYLQLTPSINIET